MVFLIFFIVCFLASGIGAICGIGGGIIIKPVLDAIGILDVEVISFLSGCTVLSMTTYSVLKGAISRDSKVKVKIGVPLALGAASGGLIGKELFSWVLSVSADKDKVGAIQAVCLLLVTLGTLLYTIYKNKIPTKQTGNVISCVVIGMTLGIMSSFLGVGGGPINLVVLFYFFSMTTKTAAEYSLYIIFFSQTASLLSSLVTRSVPTFTIGMLLLMAGGGICGGIVGRGLNKKLRDSTVDKLFMGIMVVIILINCYNIWKFMG